MKAPHGLKEIIKVYGDPRGARGKANPEWEKKNLVYVDLPYPCRLAWDTDKIVHRVRVHRLVADDVSKRLALVWAYARAMAKKTYGYGRTTEFYDNKSLGWLRSLNLDLYGGGYEYREKRAGGDLSVHSWAIALDWDPVHNAMGTKGAMPKWFVDIWTVADTQSGMAWTWGGKFANKDPMHIQCASGY
jgi:hypothetical protein